MKNIFNSLKVYLISLAIIFVLIASVWFYIGSLMKNLSLTDNLNKIKSDNTFAFSLNLPKIYSDPLLIKLFGSEFSISPLGASPAKAAEEENTVKYIDAFLNTDIVQTKYSNKLKEDIILKSPGHPEVFEYQINVEQYDFIKNELGDFIFYQKGKASDELYKLFTIPAPFLIDADGLKSASKEVETALTADGLLTLKPSQDWLAKAKYPVILDPTIEISILNIHSHPSQGENWTVEFTTKGTADLKIIPDDQATIDDDEFTGLFCDGEKKYPKILEGDIIFYPDWECLGAGKVVHNTLKVGKHTLKFVFGEQFGYAYNSPVDAPNPQGISIKANTVFKKNVIFKAGAPVLACGDSVSFTYDGSPVTYGTIAVGDQCFMDRNLGATQVATAYNDYLAYGDLFQWGRAPDGHQAITCTGSASCTADNGMTATNADVPANALFITESSSPYDWRVNQDGTLWANSSSTNNPCPASWHVPTQTEWDSALTTLGLPGSCATGSQCLVAMANSTLKLPTAGIRRHTSGALEYQSSIAQYWSSSPSGTAAYYLYFSPTDAYVASLYRAYGSSVRCVKD